MLSSGFSACVESLGLTGRLAYPVAGAQVLRSRRARNPVDFSRCSRFTSFVERGQGVREESEVGGQTDRQEGRFRFSPKLPLRRGRTTALSKALSSSRGFLDSSLFRGRGSYPPDNFAGRNFLPRRGPTVHCLGKFVGGSNFEVYFAGRRELSSISGGGAPR